MDLTEIKQSSEEIFDGKIIHVVRDAVSLPNGDITYREIVRHPGGACILPLDEEMNVYFVRQFRYAYGQELLELPAGKLDDLEDPYKAAIREMKEEVGLMSDEVLFLGEMYSSPGFTDEVISLYLAINVKQTEQQPDDDEFIQVEKMYVGDAIQAAVNGDIKDAKTQLALLKTYLLLQNLEQQELEETV
ncbi:MAG: NUDIX domain-containing protein [Christensenellaceae bacterium]|jgi:ADP-ribose pyrophosphatase